MEIQSPFGGKIHITFCALNHAIIYSESGKPITINGIKYAFRIEVGITAGTWAFGAYSDETFRTNSWPNLRFHDWTRSDSPSSSANAKLRVFLDEILSQINRGKFNAAALEGEKNRLNGAIRSRLATIKEKKEEIAALENEIIAAQIELDKLPATI